MEVLRNKIMKYGKKLWKPDKIKKKKIKSNSWFDVNIGKNNNKICSEKFQFERENLPSCKFKCKKIIILPTEQQKSILLKWFEISIKMYNATVKLLNTMRFNDKHINYDFKYVRTNYMLPIKEKLHSDSSVRINVEKKCKNKIKNVYKYIKINKHILDGAIKQACSSFKSALSNIVQKNIKHFRIRRIKQSKKQKIIHLEKGFFTNDTFCSNALGKHVKTNDDSNFSDVQTDCTLLYDSLCNRFTLLVPVKIKRDKGKDKGKDKELYENVIGLDPGIRTFLTGYSEDHILEIGNNLTSKVQKLLKRIDIINKSKMTEKQKRKSENKRYKKINDLVNDLHWKAIKQLTDNYGTILIGNMSTKGIVQNSINHMTKRIALIMRLYVFRERLKYKCSVKGCNYKMIDERYTSKMCTFCGNIKDNLGTNKIYECTKCNNIIGRDVNGSRNIYMKGIN